MKRIVLRKPFDIDIEDAETPVPDRGQVLVRTTATGIAAGTEMALYRGTNHDLVLRRWGPQWEYPMYTGYEAVGELVELGPDVSEPNVGDRVLLYGHHAEYSVSDANRVLRLPDTLADENALLAVLGTTALRGVRRAGVEYGDSVAVVGMGVLGQLAIQHAMLAGASMTIAVDTDPWRLKIAEGLGATHTVNPDTEDAAKVVEAYTGIGADAVIEAAGAPPAVPLSLSLARKRGRVSIVGWHTRPVELVLAEDFLYKELDVLASSQAGPAGEPPPDQLRWTGIRNKQLVIDYLAEGRLRTDGLVSHVLDYTEARRAYEMIDKKSEPSMQVVLRWDGEGQGGTS
jgi:2-desacetyl-2-hydroxyethyl bacteriochlorophyllide A dehydrogenase